MLEGEGTNVLSDTLIYYCLYYKCFVVFFLLSAFDNLEGESREKGKLKRKKRKETEAEEEGGGEGGGGGKGVGKSVKGCKKNLKTT